MHSVCFVCLYVCVKKNVTDYVLVGKSYEVEHWRCDACDFDLCDLCITKHRRLYAVRHSRSVNEEVKAGIFALCVLRLAFFFFSFLQSVADITARRMRLH